MFDVAGQCNKETSEYYLVLSASLLKISTPSPMLVTANAMIPGTNNHLGMFICLSTPLGESNSACRYTSS